MTKLWMSVIFVIAAAFALPALISALTAIIPAVIAGAVLVGVGTMLFRRRRHW
jgi:xanthine/uracil/vitamin C permease (AzgA family)